MRSVSSPPPGVGAPPEAAPKAPAASVPLRLTVAGGTLGLELYEPVALGPLVVHELGWSLPGLRFPLDLSGGVDVFRHRRGELERLGVRTTFAALAEHARPRLAEALGRPHAAPRVWPLAHGVGLGLVGELGALAFDLVWAPFEGQVRLVVVNPRGTLDNPLGHALRVMDTLLAPFARRQGRLFAFDDPAGAVARQVAPMLGARAPHAAGARVHELLIDNEGLALTIAAATTPAALARDAISALELALLAREADDALARGETDAARAAYLSALERAPRHPELVAAVASIDAPDPGRAEAALGLLGDALPATDFGVLGARLLARTGDLGGARRAITDAAEGEVYAPVAASAWAALAALEPDLHDKLATLDRAVATAPGLPGPRWARFEARADAADERGALADAELLEAAARGSREKHRVLTRAQQRLVARGLLQGAGKLCERALRYLPDDPDALFGLGMALLGQKQRERAAVLFARAIELGEAKGSPPAPACIELARLLADLGDHPQAVARVTQVPTSSERYPEACALEGRWRATLGDLGGASLAYARLREACAPRLPGALDPRAAAWLIEAGTFEAEHGDLAASERHFAAALKLTPTDSRARELYRKAAQSLSTRARAAAHPSDG